MTALSLAYLVSLPVAWRAYHWRRDDGDGAASGPEQSEA
jgi:hypothetical protein